MVVGDVFNPYRMFTFVVIPNCIVRSTKLTSTAKLCFGRMLQYAGEDGKCYPKQDTLAKEIGKSRIQIIRVIQELENMKLIRRIKANMEKFTSIQSNHYVFLWHTMYQDDTSQCIVGDTSNVSRVIHAPCIVGDTQRHNILNTSKKKSKEIGNKFPIQKNKNISLKDNKGDIPLSFDEKSKILKKEINKKNLVKLKEKFSKTKSVLYLEDLWQTMCSEYGYKMPMRFGSKEKSCLKSLIKRWNYTLTIPAYFELAISQWNKLKTKLVYGKNNTSKIPDKPSFMDVYLLRDEMVTILTNVLKPLQKEFNIIKRKEDIPKDNNYESNLKLFNQLGYLKLRG